MLQSAGACVIKLSLIFMSRNYLKLDMLGSEGTGPCPI